MALLLSIETSTNVCSVALHLDKDLIAISETLIEKSHAKNLLNQIRSLLEYTGYSCSQLDSIAVSQGPGSYTGLRVGVSTAKGLCYALDRPLIAVNTLDAMARGASKINVAKHVLCPMIDARRMEVYCGIYAYDSTNLVPIQAVILDSNSFKELLDVSSVTFFGNGSEKFKSVVKNENANFIDDISPSGKFIGELAEEFFQEKRFEDVAYFEPMYLKEFTSSLIQ